MYNEFENRLIKGIHKSRYVASWMKAGGNFFQGGGSFKKWLRQLIINNEHLTEEEIKEIYQFATNGKLELEINARKFDCTR